MHEVMKKMFGLDRSLVEHILLIKRNFRPHKQLPRRMTIEVTLLVKKEIKRLLKIGFRRIAKNVEWLSIIVSFQ